MSHLNAPHLPPAASSLRLRSSTQRLKWLVLAVGLSLFAGAVGSLWVLGELYDSRPLYVITSHNNNNNNTKPTLSADMVRDWRYRRVWLYDSTQVTNGVYTEAARVAPAVVLNAGGWIVWYSAGQSTPVVALDWQGIKYQIEKTVRTNSGLVFAKLAGANFRATTAFSEWPKWTETEPVWAWGADWQLKSWQHSVATPAVRLATDEVVAYQVVGAESGATITDVKGDLIGIVDKNGRVIPGWFIAAALPQVMITGQLSVAAVDWQGSFVTGIMVGPQWQESSGFYVTAARVKRGEDAVQKGDIVTAINQQPVTPDSLARMLATSPQQFSATVWRNNALHTVTVDKLEN